MKKTISICLFIVILTMCVTGGMIILDFLEKKNYDPMEIAKATEQSTETEEIAFTESMQVQKPYRYLLIEEDGMLVVYEEDGRTVLLETNIQLHGLDEKTLELLKQGIWISDESELYDLLESYSS